MTPTIVARYDQDALEIATLDGQTCRTVDVHITVECPLTPLPRAMPRWTLRSPRCAASSTCSVRRAPVLSWSTGQKPKTPAVDRWCRGTY